MAKNRKYEVRIGDRRIFLRKCDVNAHVKKKYTHISNPDDALLQAAFDIAARRLYGHGHVWVFHDSSRKEGHVMRVSTVIHPGRLVARTDLVEATMTEVDGDAR